jgi:hypothetical protein
MRQVIVSADDFGVSAAVTPSWLVRRVREGCSDDPASSRADGFVFVR